MTTKKIAIEFNTENETKNTKQNLETKSTLNRI